MQSLRGILQGLGDNASSYFPSQEVNPREGSSANEVTDLTFFDGTTMPKTQVVEISERVERLHEEDPAHILRASVIPNYQIPPEVAARFTEHGVMIDGGIDPNVTRVVQSVELSVFHAFGGGAAGHAASRIADAYKAQAAELRMAGDTYGAEESMKLFFQAQADAQMAGITTFEQLYRAGLSSISEPKN